MENLYDRLNSFGIAKMQGVEQAQFPEIRVAESELDETIWSVISFEGIAAVGLAYKEAMRLLSDLDDRGVAGLSIVTNDAAAHQNSRMTFPKLSLDSRYS